MNDELPKTREIPKPQPIVPFPGLPATDCMGECCDQHYTIRAATSLVKAGRKLEQNAMKVGLQKLAKKYKGTDSVNVFEDILQQLSSGELTEGKKP